MADTGSRVGANQRRVTVSRQGQGKVVGHPVGRIGQLVQAHGNHLIGGEFVPHEISTLHQPFRELPHAVIAEPILGERGCITPPVEYFPKIEAICEEFGILFIADEIQTGIGRTGTMFAMEHGGVDADITTVAKSLAAGMPLSAVVGRKELMDTVHAGGNGGTHGGNPVACAAAISVFDIFETEDLLARGKALGIRLRARFDAFRDPHEIIGDVRGIGPMLALELVQDRQTKKPAGAAAKALLKYCYERGLVLLACGSQGNVIRVLMPLVIADDQLERGLGILEEGLAMSKDE